MALLKICASRSRVECGGSGVARQPKSMKTVKAKKYVFRYKARGGHYRADIFSLRCFDNRFWKTFKRFMKFMGIGDIDPESPAGGAKVFASPEKKTDREFFLREIAKSVKLHKTRRVILFTHSDCGAYGGLSRFDGDEEKEFKFHVRELRRAKKVVRKRFPKLIVETYFIDSYGVIRVT